MNETELAVNADQLPERFADRIGDNRFVRNLAHGGEWGLLLQELLLSLRSARASITPDEREHLADMVGSLDTDEAETVTIDQPLVEVLDEIIVREPQ